MALVKIFASSPVRPSTNDPGTASHAQTASFDKLTMSALPEPVLSLSKDAAFATFA